MRKEFTIEEDGKEVKFCVKPPSREDLEESDRMYACKIGSLLKSEKSGDLLLRDQLDKFLQREGIWTDQDEADIDEINTNIKAKLTKLRKGGLKLSEGREICIQILEHRSQMAIVRSKRRSFDESTVEYIAEQEKIDYLIFADTVGADNGNRCWESFEDMKSDKDNSVYAAAATKMYEFVFGVDDQFEQRLPENRWLKKYSFINEDLRFTNRKTGDLVDRKGDPVSTDQLDILDQFNDIQGEIISEEPFIDDDTNEPVEEEDLGDIDAKEEESDDIQPKAEVEKPKAKKKTNRKRRTKRK